MTTSPVLRAVVAAGLVLAAVLTITSIQLMPDFSGDHADRLRAVAASPRASAVSAVTFTLSQLVLAVGVLGVAHVLRPRVPALAATAGALVLLGTFGHAVYGGISLLMLSMAEDPAAVDRYADLLASAEQGAPLPFMAAGLLGTVLGFVVLGVALWRGGLGPRWLGPAAVLWVLVEFVGSNFSRWAGYASGLLWLAVLATLAVEVWRAAPAPTQDPRPDLLPRPGARSA